MKTKHPIFFCDIVPNTVCLVEGSFKDKKLLKFLEEKTRNKKMVREDVLSLIDEYYEQQQ